MTSHEPAVAPDIGRVQVIRVPDTTTTSVAPISGSPNKESVTVAPD